MNAHGFSMELEEAGQLAAQPPAALAACKQILADTEELPLQDALKNEQSVFQSVRSRIRRVN